MKNPQRVEPGAGCVGERLETQKAVIVTGVASGSDDDVGRIADPERGAGGIVGQLEPGRRDQCRIAAAGASEFQAERELLRIVATDVAIG